MSDRRGRRNFMRELLQSSKPLLVGAFITMSDPTVVDIAALSGHDFILLDSEHAGLNMETIANHIRAARARELGTMIRVPAHNEGYIQRVLDVGVDGVEVPHVRTAADAKLAASALRFPPIGTRGVFSKGVAAEYGAHGYDTVEELFAAVNRDVVCNVIIEDVEGVENIDEIVAVPGLDFLTFGPSDVSGSYGVPGQLAHPSVHEAGAKVMGACRRANIPVHTTAAWAPASMDEMAAAGIRLLTSSSDAMNLLVGMRADAAFSRRETAEHS
jgi:2-keto-3-deoxy-L-rhamnonate aldolase RhmA